MAYQQGSNTTGWTSPLFWSLFLALSARVLVAILLPGPVRPDEIYQYFEPAFRLLTGHGVITWEWREGIRSWLMPGEIAGLLRIANFLGMGFSITFVHVVLAVFSLPLVALFVLAGWRQAGYRGAWLFGISGALWPDIVNAGFRPLGEYAGGNMLAAGTIAGMIALDRRRNGEPYRAGTALFLLCGLSMGSAVALRFQFAPAVLFGGLFLFWQGGWRTLVPVTIGLIPPLAILGIVDAMTLNYPFQSVFHNYYVNVTQGVADKFGRKNILYFPFRYMAWWGAAGIAMVLFCIKGAKDAVFPLTMALVIIGYHSCIPHKEMSFIYPALPLLVLTATAGLARFVAGQGWTGKPFVRIVALQISCCVLTFCSTYLPMLKDRSAPIRIQKLAFRQTGFCGLAQLEPSDFLLQFGGYSLMPPGKPFYAFETTQQLEQNRGAYSHVLADPSFAIFSAGARLIACSGNDRVCLYRVASSCTGTPDFDQFSEILQLDEK
ncbi:glycosyltransferase family protein [Acetobacter oeni]|uniref:Mannosyltransferase n=1 Tax=Acetobacter oeni TaxID=304077 RepID=A0A511XHP8_9PROT|nr:hypothetical protein [Acetobacter oeni]MBB3882589.1 hypothetical protein [Acetobacter oeni]NHO18602.1 hypothetical protein [Acetobacter oeni]GBR12054.1 Alg9-like mannosyltransferase [Acetobacter oeni LMG 21952]GEN62476.1 hypothetical protein AOE01nite_07000 [Acetobacter oeni]